jgi:hypothetical protein
MLPLVKAMLKVIEETVPVQRIWLDTVENKDIARTGFTGDPPENVTEILETLYEDMIGRRGMSSVAAKRTLCSTDPFQNYPNLVAALPDDPNQDAD